MIMCPRSFLYTGAWEIADSFLLFAELKFIVKWMGTVYIEEHTSPLSEL